MQIPFKINLKAASMPMTSIDSGKTVLLGRYDQKDSQPKINIREVDKEDSGAPEVVYAENVLPTAGGYKSVGYATVVPPTNKTSFTSIIACNDSDDNFGYIGITYDGETYLWYSSIEWINITPSGQPKDIKVTSAFVNGITYICYEKFNIFTVDLVAGSLNAVTLTGITNSNIKGIVDSNNYLVLYDDTTVYWSSAVDPTDFIPSLATGAGSSIPAALRGFIIACKNTVTGFMVFSSTNMIATNFSGNVQYPWIFKEIPNSVGISEAHHVTDGSEIGFNYAWTSGGLSKISPSASELMLPELTTFISSKLQETFSLSSKVLSHSYQLRDFRVKLSYVGSRYLCISYGIDSGNYTHAIIYDTLLDRLGKLVVDHVDIFDIIIDVSSGSATYKDTYPATYDSSAGLTYVSGLPSALPVAKVGKTIGILSANGLVQHFDFSLESTSYNSVLLLGKYQITRSSWIELHEVLLEAVQANNSQFAAYIIPSYDGKSWATAPIPLYLLSSSEYARQYSTDITGYNVSLLLIGSFNVTSLVLVASQGGRI